MQNTISNAAEAFILQNTRTYTQNKRTKNKKTGQRSETARQCKSEKIRILYDPPSKRVRADHPTHWMFYVYDFQSREQAHIKQ